MDKRLSLGLLNFMSVNQKLCFNPLCPLRALKQLNCLQESLLIRFFNSLIDIWKICSHFLNLTDSNHWPIPHSPPGGQHSQRDLRRRCETDRRRETNSRHETDRRRETNSRHETDRRHETDKRGKSGDLRQTVPVGNRKKVDDRQETRVTTGHMRLTVDMRYSRDRR